MPALTADKIRTTRGDAIGIAYGVEASSTLYLGSLLAFSASGHVAAATDTASLAIAGVSRSHVDNSSGSDGDKSVVAEFGHLEDFAASGLVQADIGKNVFALDDATVTDAAGATNDLKVGTLRAINGTTATVHVGVFADVDA